MDRKTFIEIRAQAHEDHNRRVEKINETYREEGAEAYQIAAEQLERVDRELRKRELESRGRRDRAIDDSYQLMYRTHDASAYDATITAVEEAIGKLNKPVNTAKNYPGIREPRERL